MFQRWLWMIAILLVARVASAQPEADADALLREGVELRKQGKEREALDRFEAAYAMTPTPRARAQMGLAAKSLRMFVRAELYLKEALAAESDAWVLENREALSLALDVAQKNLAWLEVRSNVPAELSVDGNVIGTLPMSTPVRVRVGAIRIDVKADGYEPWSSGETLVSGATAIVDVTLTPQPASPAVKALKDPPAPRARPAPAVVDGAPPDGSRRTWTWVAAGVGAAGVVAGSIFGIRAISLKNQRDEVCPSSDCPSEKGVTLDRDARDAATYSTIGFAVGVAGLGTAAILYFTTPKRRPEASSFSLGMTPLGGYARAAF